VGEKGVGCVAHEKRLKLQMQNLVWGHSVAMQAEMALSVICIGAEFGQFLWIHIFPFLPHSSSSFPLFLPLFQLYTSATTIGSGELGRRTTFSVFLVSNEGSLTACSRNE